MIRVCSSRIQILPCYPSRIPGSKRHWIPDPDPQHWILTFPVGGVGGWSTHPHPYSLSSCWSPPSQRSHLPPDNTWQLKRLSRRSLGSFIIFSSPPPYVDPQNHPPPDNTWQLERLSHGSLGSFIIFPSSSSYVDPRWLTHWLIIRAEPKFVNI